MGATVDKEVVKAATALAEELLHGAMGARRDRRPRREARLRRILHEPSGTRLVLALADRVLRPYSPVVAARELRAVADGDLAALSTLDRTSLRLAAAASTVAPRSAVALVRARLLLETSPYVAGAEPWRLRARLSSLRRSGKRPNLNVLGEAVLGWEEAGRRAAVVEALLKRPDVDCVSVKLSSIAPGRSLVDLEGSVARAAEPLRSIYRRAASTSPRKLVNLDMEEHADLALTVALFEQALDDPELAQLTPGIALQAYLPDSHAALDELIALAGRRRALGRAPIRVRLVKGANLAMERVEAELRGWPSPAFSTKAETDASFVALLEQLVHARADGLVDVGVASHNLFDVALAIVLAERAGTELDVEMLVGMADDQADAVVRRQGRLLLYVPIATRRSLRDAIAYLARRLDENAAPDGFLRQALEIAPGTAAWLDQSRRFADSCAARHRLDTAPRQTQDRSRAAAAPSPPPAAARFANEPDTDLTVAANRRFASEALALGHRPAPRPATVGDVDGAVARARQGAASMGAIPWPRRRRLLLQAAEELAAGRKEAIAVMAAEAGKTFAEADPEVSEAVDYARFYAHATGLIEALEATTDATPLGVVVVAPPWNFPFAIPAGGVLAALAAGNAAILKPSPQVRATGALLVELLGRAGFPPDAVQLVPTPDDEAGQHLVGHPEVDGVVLTGSYETALRFAGWAPHRRLLAETSGKNAIVVAATADVDLAVADVVRSAFGHAGQKCSAASLAIVDASIHDRSPFLRQLADATRSLRVGPATDPATEVGPIVGPMTPALERALASLEPGESWLVEPRRIDDRLFAPGVRIGVRPGSWTHLTEWFGPVLGVMRARSLEEATTWQNDVAYGLTAGLHALDPEEQRYWLARVEAGNCYLNRHVTGAIVGRQPFGGWKRSSLGPTAKTGGPNYLLGFRRWRDRAPVAPGAAIASYERAMRAELGMSTELAGLACESNELRYRPFRAGVTVRLGPGFAPGSLEKAAAAAALAGTPVRFSSPVALEPPPGVAVDMETGDVLAKRLRAEPPGRLRLLGAVEPGVYEAAAEGATSVLDEPIAAEGRLEMPRWLREQTVSRSLQRYGSVVYSPLDLARSRASEMRGAPPSPALPPAEGTAPARARQGKEERW